MDAVLFSQFNVTELDDIITRAVQKALKGLSTAQSATAQEDIFLTPSEAAEFLGFTKGTLYVYTSKGILPVMKRGKKLYFSKQELTKYLRAGKRLSNSEVEELAASKAAGKKVRHTY